MKYTKFIIEKYKGISTPIELNMHNGVYPIVGLNESGKTTILKAICAFDSRNDDLYPENIKKVGNLYTNSKTAKITALIEIDGQELRKIIEGFKQDGEAGAWDFYNQKIQPSQEIEISRELNGGKKYRMQIKVGEEPTKGNFHEETQEKICLEIIKGLPAILYFDDFNDSHSGSISVTKEEKEGNTSYTSDKELDMETIKVLIEKAYSQKPEDARRTLGDVFGAKEDKNELRNIAGTLNTQLNSIINKRWQELSVNEGYANVILNIEPNTKKKHSNTIDFEFTVTEKVEEEDRHFNIDQRSKGFMWFFLFIYKTELSPSRLNNQNDVIYLLDEPGCYLHLTAQKELCKVMGKLGENAVVIYNTHSHYLLSNESLPNTYIASKKDGDITLRKYTEYKEKGNREALDPIRNALRVEKPILTKQYIPEKIVIFEGVTDFYIFDMFVDAQNKKDIGMIPSLGAPSVHIYLSMLIPYKTVLAVFDNDKEGNKAINKHEGYKKYCTQYESELEDMLDNDEFSNFSEKELKNKDTNKKAIIPILYKKASSFNLKESSFNLKEKMPKTHSTINNFWNEKIVKYFNDK